MLLVDYKVLYVRSFLFLDTHVLTDKRQTEYDTTNTVVFFVGLGLFRACSRRL